MQKKLETDGIHINQNVIEYLAQSIDTNVRELEGVIISLMAHASLDRKEVDLELAKRTLGGIVVNNEKEPSIDNILKAVTEMYHVSIEDLKSKSRKKENVLPRQMAMYMLKEMTSLPLKSIGYQFSNRDHSTVIHAIQSINSLVEFDKTAEKNIEKLFRQFNKTFQKKATAVLETA